MSSTYVRGQANLHDSFESNSSNTNNKRKRVNNQNPTHTNLHLNMHPPPAAQDLSDHHQLQTHEAAEADNEAAALLHHMHLMHHDDRLHPLDNLMHHDDRPLPLDNLMHVDYHENGNAAGHHPVADHEMLHPRAPRQIARENSGSSDASATNYFSGDSDLTAEPIVRCATDEDGAKSSNSGSSTPFKVPRRASPSTNHSQALAAGVGHEYSINLLPQHVKSTCNDKEEAAQMSPTAVVQPSTSTTSTSMWNCKTSPDSKILASSQMMHMHAARTMIGSCHSSQAEGADSGNCSESWLELRLGFSAELQKKLAQNLDASVNPNIDEQRKSAESMDGMTESTLVTLQLLPNNSKVTEVNAGAGGIMRAGIVPGSCPYSDLPPVYQATAGNFSHARPKFDENHHTITRLVQPDRTQISLDQIKDPAVPALQPVDHQRFLMSPNNIDPAADLYQNNQRSALTAGIVYDQAHVYAHSNDQRRCLAAETSDMMMMTAPSMIPAARPTEIYRPTPSLGWPNGNADTRSWSANSYTPPVHLQRTMSWQGLLRSMTTDPLLHPLPDLPMCSFDSGTELAGSRRRHMFPAASANRPPSGHTMPTDNQRLRLSTSRRSAGLWFSLQEAHHYSNENADDEEEQHRSMQKVYLRIRDGKMQISVLQSYLLRKLESSGSYDSHEVEITCRGKTLAPTLTIQHVRDTIWLSKDIKLNEAIGFRYQNSFLNDSHNKIMALCYQRHHTQAVTLNLLKT